MGSWTPGPWAWDEGDILRTEQGLAVLSDSDGLGLIGIGVGDPRIAAAPEMAELLAEWVSPAPVGLDPDGLYERSLALLARIKGEGE